MMIATKLRDLAVGCGDGTVSVLTDDLRRVGFPVPDGSDHAAVVSAPELVKHCEAKLSGEQPPAPEPDVDQPAQPDASDINLLLTE